MHTGTQQQQDNCEYVPAGGAQQQKDDLQKMYMQGGLNPNRKVVAQHNHTLYVPSNKTMMMLMMMKMMMSNQEVRRLCFQTAISVTSNMIADHLSTNTLKHAISFSANETQKERALQM
jgi:hypothetical protein